MANMMQMMKQAQQMKKNMAALQERLADVEMQGAAGGLVQVTVNGKNEVRRVKIDPKALEDIETLEDLVAAATNDAMQKVQDYVQAEVNKATGGMNLGF